MLLQPKSNPPVYKLHLSAAEKDRLDDLCNFGILFMRSVGGRIADEQAVRTHAVSAGLLYMLPEDVTPDRLREMSQARARLEFVIHPDNDPLPADRWEKTDPPRIVLPS